MMVTFAVFLKSPTNSGKKVFYERINHHHCTLKNAPKWLGARSPNSASTIAGLVLGFLLAFLPGLFAAVTQFPADDAYIYQLAGSAILGYGVALSMGLFQQSWLAVRLVVIGVLVNNLG